MFLFELLFATFLEVLYEIEILEKFMIAIRADANKEIATGHIMRCMSIADRLCDLGQKPIFITADNSAKDLIASKGYNSICLNTIWNNMNSETEKILRVIKESNINTLLVDSYYVTKEYLESLNRVIKVFYIDDLDMFEYPVDTVINYSIYADKFDYENRYKKLGMNTKFLLGCQYVQLRKEFENVSYKFREVVKNILITTGGTDNYNIAGMLSEMFVRQEWIKDITIHVIEGAYNANHEILEKLSVEYGNIKLHKNVQNMAELMVECDIAISAGGSTLYELCACGVPTISVSFADNQLENVKRFDKEGLIIYAGDVREDMEKILDVVQKNFIFMANEFSIRKEYSDKMKLSVTVNGAKSIAVKIFGA